METKAGDPGAFRHFDLNRVPSPAFVVDEAAVRRNLAVLADVRDRAGIKMLAALKAFSFWQLGDVVSDYLDGTCSSGLWEAKLASHHYHGEIATYCAGYKAEDLREILKLSDHVIFNSPGQIARFAPLIEEARAAGQSFDIGLRINPALPLGETEKYDPSQPHSRLGHPIDQLRPEHLEGVSGIHFHSLCEQDLVPLQQIWTKLEPLLEPYFNQLKWLNFGGGHHITRADYQRDELVEFLIAVKARTGCEIYLEPGEAVALDAGILVGELLDVFDNGMKVGITDISATCHMPDVIEAPYRPAMLGERSDAEPIRLGGPSCLAGDIIGDYGLPVPLEPGQRFAFLDQAHYSMVKTNTFNGVPLPSIWLWNSDDDSLREIASFGYETFRDRLG
ncbi:carboxynorspermidine decarboxylase [Blastomonas natatoria]|uniref:Carboxynorspermidine/carboxyspermidine decarboxylase n=1 Tax=Blastomonas natatoria TaxID=34015 RepID=A0A2V3V2L6_9SPHN|nr:carboxynorspermidine decarboxylase [Blastomonas natatoria]PXW75161.1 carboxynorspermidine decarboxylase [Blastomonas natatoria]